MAKKRRQGEGGPEGENVGTEGAVAKAQSVLSRAAERSRALVGQAQERGRAVYGRSRTFVKDHPAALLAVAAGVGIVFEAEIALGALVGIALTELLEHRREAGGLVERGRGLLARGIQSVRTAVGPKEQSAETRP